VRRSELHRLRDDIEATLVEIDRVEQRCRADLRALSR
jgi:hypothetical protein